MRFVPLLLSALLLAGCQPPPPKLTGSGMDMFAPASLRLHQFSRLLNPLPPATATAPATAPVPPPITLPAVILEARIELQDQFQEPTKSPGTIQLELFDQPPLTHKGALLQAWTLSLNTPEDNRDHWDRTTRMYVFKLPLTQPPPKRDHVLVTATLTLPNGAQLSGEIELPLK